MKETAYNHSRQKRYTAEEKQAILNRWRTSGLAKIAFCKEQRIAPSTFYQWFNESQEPLRAGPPHLSAVHLIDKQEIPIKEGRDQAFVELSLPTQAVLRFKLPAKELALFITELCHATATIR